MLSPQNRSLGQLHTDGDVPTFGSSAGSLQPVWSSAYLLHSFGCFLKRHPWKAQEKGNSHETKHCRQTDAPSWQCPMSHCPLRHRIFHLKKHSCSSPAPLFTWPQPLWHVLKESHFGTLKNIQKSVMDMLKTISVEDFQRCYQKRSEERRVGERV